MIIIPFVMTIPVATLMCVSVCNAEVLVLGVGARIQRVPENVKAYLRSKAIALEVADTVCVYASHIGLCVCGYVWHTSTVCACVRTTGVVS